MSGTQVQTTAAFFPWQKGRVEQRIATIKTWRAKWWRGAHVSCQLGGCPRAEPKSREVGHHPSDTSFWPANEGPRRTDGTRGGSPSEGGGRRRRAGKTFIIRASAREAFEEHAASEAIRRQFKLDLTVEVAGGCGLVEGPTCAPLNTCSSHARRSGFLGLRREETVGRAAQGSLGGTRKLRGLDIPGNWKSRHAMTWISPWMTLFCGAGETASSTEIGGQSISWRRRGASIGQQADWTRKHAYF